MIGVILIADAKKGTSKESRWKKVVLYTDIPWITKVSKALIMKNGVDITWRAYYEPYNLIHIF